MDHNLENKVLENSTTHCKRNRKTFFSHSSLLYGWFVSFVFNSWDSNKMHFIKEDILHSGRMWIGWNSISLFRINIRSKPFYQGPKLYEFKSSFNQYHHIVLFLLKIIIFKAKWFQIEISSNSIQLILTYPIY